MTDDGYTRKPIDERDWPEHLRASLGVTPIVYPPAVFFCCSEHPRAKALVVAITEADEKGVTARLDEPLCVECGQPLHPIDQGWLEAHSIEAYALKLKLDHDEVMMGSSYVKGWPAGENDERVDPSTVTVRTHVVEEGVLGQAETTTHRWLQAEIAGDDRCYVMTERTDRTPATRTAKAWRLRLIDV